MSQFDLNLIDDPKFDADKRIAALYERKNIESALLVMRRAYPVAPAATVRLQPAERRETKGGKSMKIGKPESGVPVSRVKQRGRPKGPLYTAVMNLEVGESILIENVKVKNTRTLILTWKKKSEKRFTTRSVGPNSMRVWRIE